MGVALTGVYIQLHTYIHTTKTILRVIKKSLLKGGYVLKEMVLTWGGRQIVALLKGVWPISKWGPPLGGMF